MRPKGSAPECPGPGNTGDPPSSSCGRIRIWGRWDFLIYFLNKFKKYLFVLSPLLHEDQKNQSSLSARGEITRKELPVQSLHFSPLLSFARQTPWCMCLQYTDFSRTIRQELKKERHPFSPLRTGEERPLSDTGEGNQHCDGARSRRVIMYNWCRDIQRGGDTGRKYIQPGSNQIFPRLHARLHCWLHSSFNTAAY